MNYLFRFSEGATDGTMYLVRTGKVLSKWIFQKFDINN